ncbi:MAG TPA: hypothetical protein VGY31_01780 [Terriglobia bacterium]|nr:hypothetical protein [Terriglobia bacterium]
MRSKSTSSTVRGANQRWAKCGSSDASRMPSTRREIIVVRWLFFWLESPRELQIKTEKPSWPAQSSAPRSASAKKGLAICGTGRIHSKESAD